MNTARGLHGGPSRAHARQCGAPAPLPFRATGSHKALFELHTERDPWLPLQDVYPDLPGPLWNVTVAVVSVVAALVFLVLVVLLLS